MPTYDMWCPKCLHQEEVFCKISEMETQQCSCGNLLSVRVSMPNFIPFHGGFHEHIAAEPIYIKNKKHLQQECRSRGLTSHYVDKGAERSEY